MKHLIRTLFSRTSLLSISSPTNSASRRLCLNTTRRFRNNSYYHSRLLTFSPYLNTTHRRLFNTHTTNPHHKNGGTTEDETSEEGETDGWEEEEEDVEPQIGDGGDGGGVVLQGVPWGERALAVAREVLSQSGDGIELFAFKTTPRGYVYVRLDKLANEYGCPSMEELESYCREYKKRLEEVGALGEIPDNLALDVSSPGAERLLKVPDDLYRFKDMPMRVCYVEDVEKKDGVFFLDSIEKESEICVWKLADVKENRDPESKGRPLNRKMRDWRLKVPFKMHRLVTFYVEF
ncbi:uncharacterized protein LOC126685802 [Mercurialis annua]|uniref:uncharacterized protein LOC126685802 n=1 Tax=Mercurialis annua TaxID=3986 RepID=UPI00216099D9|nr:uncharacterized protein LOC126685802 [Mercurialis annua]